MTVRVLLADDQVPSDSDEENKNTKEEIVRELGAKLPNVEHVYEENHRWYQGLLDYLSNRQNATIIKVKTIAHAQSALKVRDSYDVAIIDISWHGDRNLTSGRRGDAGLKLLQTLALDNRESKDPKALIAFSQNFETDLELVATVLECGALPIQKDYQKPQLCYRTLTAAVKLLARVHAKPEVETRDVANLTIKQLLMELKASQLWAVGTALVLAVAGLVGFAFWFGKAFGDLAK
jgi:CheY-like chemotaxis protein